MKTPLQVLIVEDSDDDSTLLLRALDKGGFAANAERVWNERQMREALERRSWDIILSDYMMGGFDALAALSLVKEAGLDIPVILVSGLLDEKRTGLALSQGACDHLSKDNLERLAPVVAQALQQKQSRRRGADSGPA